MSSMLSSVTSANVSVNQALKRTTLKIFLLSYIFIKYFHINCIRNEENFCYILRGESLSPVLKDICLWLLRLWVIHFINIESLVSKWFISFIKKCDCRSANKMQKSTQFFFLKELNRKEEEQSSTEKTAQRKIIPFNPFSKSWVFIRKTLPTS